MDAAAAAAQPLFVASKINKNLSVGEVVIKLGVKTEKAQSDKKRRNETLRKSSRARKTVCVFFYVAE